MCDDNVQHMVDKRTARRENMDSFVAAIDAWRRGVIPRSQFMRYPPAPPEAQLRVFARKRPIFEHEVANCEYDSVSVESPDRLITVHKCQMHADMKRMYIDHPTFSGDAIFDEDSTNDNVFEAAVLPALRNVDRNVTVCMYGQTGSGKTHTMGGIIERAIPAAFELSSAAARTSPPAPSTEREGRGREATDAPRAPLTRSPIRAPGARDSSVSAEDLDASTPTCTSSHPTNPPRRASTSGTTGSLGRPPPGRSRGKGSGAASPTGDDEAAAPFAGVACLEVAGTAVRDLFAGGANVSVCDDGRGGTAVVGLTQVEVSNAEEALQAFRAAQKNRATCATAVNHASSRTHAFYILDVGGRRLQMVDLAGSERHLDSKHHTADRIEETKYINTSLAALKVCLAPLRSMARSAAAEYGGVQPFQPGRRRSSARAGALPNQAPPPALGGAAAFRQSVLTRLLKSALEVHDTGTRSSSHDKPRRAPAAGARHRTGSEPTRPHNGCLRSAPAVVVIATLSPQACDVEHTMDTLNHVLGAPVTKDSQDIGYAFREPGTGPALSNAAAAVRAVLESEAAAVVRVGGAGGGAAGVKGKKSDSGVARGVGGGIGVVTGSGSDRTVAVPPQRWSAEQVAAFVGDAGDFPSNTTGAMLVRFPKQRFVQACGSESAGEALYTRLRAITNGVKEAKLAMAAEQRNVLAARKVEIAKAALAR